MQVAHVDREVNLQVQSRFDDTPQSGIGAPQPLRDRYVIRI